LLSLFSRSTARCTAVDPVKNDSNPYERVLLKCSWDFPAICGVKYGRNECGDEMVDPTSDLGEDVSEEDAPRCVT